ncbi:hypothetical protein [Rhizobium sp. NXC24]|uniref:hypothetical protein n=1 Tax=Rhizobium sp. NXC24 TaxID=2048897 RepID=UPI000CDF4E16|nr:hypothetical protein [Rhizobium sp. NXC24]AVA25378.1 hypothetical protein NXC24_PC00934 [Rhizobium sp. NXC24]
MIFLNYQATEGEIFHFRYFSMPSFEPSPPSGRQPFVVDADNTGFPRLGYPKDARDVARIGKLTIGLRLSYNGDRGKLG